MSVQQAKTVFQAEIDSTCETIDFFRFAVKQGLDLQVKQYYSSINIFIVIKQHFILSWYKQHFIPLIKILLL